MSNNFKVNARTSILRFKEQYNKFVDALNVKIETSNIENLSDDVLNNLKCGDIVIKKTGNLKHAYIVSYKEENHGICLSYFAAGYTETISYDYLNGHWQFNSKDVVPIENVENAPSGTIQDVLGLNSSGKLVKGSVSGGTQLYKHTITWKRINTDTMEIENDGRKIEIISTSNQNLVSADIWGPESDDFMQVLTMYFIGKNGYNADYQTKDLMPSFVDSDMTILFYLSDVLQFDTDYQFMSVNPEVIVAL